MIATVKLNSIGKQVVAAKLLTGYTNVNEKIDDPESFIKIHETFDASFETFFKNWQRTNNLVDDGVCGPKSWTKISGLALTCSTSKNRISRFTMALQMLIDSSITADAIYGPRTKNAVAAFQVAKGLTADGICGPMTWRSLITGSVPIIDESGGGVSTNTQGAGKPVAGKFVKPTDFKQYDSRWGSKTYTSTGNKSQTMANSACGPTSMADIINFVIDKKVTPYTLAQKAIKWGDRTKNSGTAWSFFTHIQKEYGYKKMIATKSLETLKACLDAGGYVVCSMGPGYWTKGGHFICCWKYDSASAYCNDPASAKRKSQTLKNFQSQRKQFFCFFPN